MKKKLVSVIAAMLAMVAVHAAEFGGVIEGFDSGGRLIVSGKAYPLKPDAQALVGNQLVAIELLPLGTQVRFELGQHEGVSSILHLQVEGELNAGVVDEH